MGLKNYSTNISTEQTIMEIEDILRKHKATDIWKQYDTNGNIITMNFAIFTEFGKIPFRLPVNIESVIQILKSEKKDKKINLSNQQVNDYRTAQRIAWRIMKDWIDAQMALIDIDMVRIEQVFLPYVYDFNKKQSFYEVLKERKFSGLLMESSESI